MYSNRWHMKFCRNHGRMHIRLYCWDTMPRLPIWRQKNAGCLRYMISMGYVLVTETEAHEVRDAVFGFMHDDDKMRPKPICETSIREIGYW